MPYLFAAAVVLLFFLAAAAFFGRVFYNLGLFFFLALFVDFFSVSEDVSGVFSYVGNGLHNAFLSSEDSGCCVCVNFLCVLA